MKRRKIGTREEHIAYLNENKQMDRSILAFNLQAKFGLKKKEAASMIREWHMTECDSSKSEDSDDNPEEEEDEEGYQESVLKENKYGGVGLDDYGDWSPAEAGTNEGDMQHYAQIMQDYLNQGYTSDQVLKVMAGRWGRKWNNIDEAFFAKVFKRVTGKSIEQAQVNVQRELGRNKERQPATQDSGMYPDMETTRF